MSYESSSLQASKQSFNQEYDQRRKITKSALRLRSIAVYFSLFSRTIKYLRNFEFDLREDG
jgi:hypothetical protein